MANSGIVGLAPGVHHTCALRDGQVFCWGLNRRGMLGVGVADGDDGDDADILRPRLVPGLDHIIQVVADYDYTCAVNATHGVYCWGANDKAQLGTGDLDPRSTPTRIPGLVADRVVAEFGRACAVRPDSVHCWGSGDFGDGKPFRREQVPVAIRGIVGFDELALGSAHGCILKGGEVHCWGLNASGQLGNGEGGCRYEHELPATGRRLPPQECKHSPLPVRAIGLPAIVELRPGGSFTHARDTAGQIWAWGQQGQTMDFGATNPSYRPHLLAGLPEATPMVELDAGGSHACARTRAGELWCWGNNAFGQLGHPPLPRGSDEGPARVEGLPPVTAIALGFYFSCALTGTGADTRIWCWGDNGNGQLGDGTAERRHTPVQVQWPAA